MLRHSLCTAVLLLALGAPGADAQVPEPPPLPPGLRQVDPPELSQPARVSGGQSVIATSGQRRTPTPTGMPIPDDGLSVPKPAAPQKVPVIIGATSRVPTPTEQPAARSAPMPETIATPSPPTGPPITQPALSASAQTAAVHLEKIGPPSFNVGKPLAYEIVLRNSGAVPVHQVRIQDEMPAGARLLAAEPQPQVEAERMTWDLGTVEAGAERRCRVQLQPAGEGEIQATVAATFTTTCTLKTRITRPQLTVTKTGPQAALVGDPVPFQVVVSNPGTGPATHVLIHDRLPAGLQHQQGSEIEAEIGTLGPGESKTITLETTAIKSGRHVNEVTVTADDNLQASAQAAVTVTGASLALRKNGPQQSFLQHDFEHTLEVVNSGDAPATSVKVFDVLPEGLDFISASDGGAYDKASRRCEWVIGGLAPGQVRTVTIKMMATKAGDWLNQALAQGDRGLEAKAGNPVHVEGVPALMLEVVDLDDPVEVGNETVYEIRVVNQGNAACINVRIVATVPDGLAAVSAEGPATHRIQGQQVAFDPVPKLAGRADAVYKVKVKGVKSGDWRFKVSLTCDQLGRPVYEEESTRVYNDAVKDEPVGTPPPPPPPPAPGGPSLPPSASRNNASRPVEAVWVGKPVRNPAGQGPREYVGR